MIKSLLLSFLKTYNQDKENANMKLLKSILEAVTEKLLDVCEGAADLFVKGCEPDSWDKLRDWLNTPSAPTRDIDPVTPFGGF